MEPKTLYEGEFLNLVRQGQWEYVERVRATGAAIIVAVTPADELLVVEQFRIPVSARTLELPAGIIGDDPATPESHEEAAKRELLEETGWRASAISSLVTGASSSGVTSEVVTLFHATGLQKVHQGGGVAHEEITVHQVPLASVDHWLATKASEGFLVDPKLYAGLYFLNKKTPGKTA
jgi:ADP-ribose pyrophosphatase